MRNMKQAWARLPYILEPKPPRWRNHLKLVDHANGARMVEGSSLWPQKPEVLTPCTANNKFFNSIGFGLKHARPCVYPSKCAAQMQMRTWALGFSSTSGTSGLI